MILDWNVWIQMNLQPPVKILEKMILNLTGFQGLV